MILLLVTLLFAFTFWFAYKKRHRAVLITMSLGVVLLLCLGYGFPTRYLVTDLQSDLMATNTEWKAHNVIVMLGGGVEQATSKVAEVHAFGYSRIVKAAALYRDCKATGKNCRVIVSGGDPVGSGISEAQLYGNALTSIGVDAADLILETQSKNTWENAKYSAQLIRSMPDSFLVVVSSASHLKRSALYMGHFGLRPDALIRSDYINVVKHSVPQAYNLLVFDVVAHEYLGIQRFRLYNAMGWNGEAVETKLKTVY